MIRESNFAVAPMVTKQSFERFVADSVMTMITMKSFFYWGELDEYQGESERKTSTQHMYEKAKRIEKLMETCEFIVGLFSYEADNHSNFEVSKGLKD